MLTAGKALKVSIYLNEASRHHGVASDAAILDFLFFHKVAGAAVFKGVAGFGAEHHLHSASLVELSDRLPVKVDALMGELMELAGRGMIEVQETTIVKAGTAAEPVE
jgi:PII-like signaling protein